ncbi:citrate synthase [Clostridia bacterium]|nr:citrate synthase [Clostridia bacterium]
MQESLDKFVNTICGGYYQKNTIKPELYEQYRVSRGLRNPDGSGVLAGLTSIGSVQGGYMRDGERIPIEGKLYYRSYEINDIIAGLRADNRKYGFEETIYLLLTGELPTKAQAEEFHTLLSELYALPGGFTENMILKAPSGNVMNKIARSILALYSFDDNPDACTAENMLRQSLELIARIPLIASHAYAVKRHYYDNQSLVLHRPQENLSIAENLLYTLGPVSGFSDEEARALDLCLVLHAEHGGGNNSAFAARVLASSGTDTYSALSAAVGSLKGPLHGGANAKVAAMLADFKENLQNGGRAAIGEHIAKTLDKKAGDGSGLIYGMGHAVYTLSDPRAKILREMAGEMADRRGGEFLKEFTLIETIAELTPGLFRERRGGKVISPNVDLYSGLVYKMCHIPEELFTPVFAVARMPGWCAHRIEEKLYGGRIIRPAYRAVINPRKYSLISERT